MLTWLRHLPADSALAREADPDSMWDLNAHLLAGIVDRLEVANYQRTDGKGPKPKPLPRPGVEGPKRSGTPHTREEIWQRLRGTAPPTREVADG